MSFLSESGILIENRDFFIPHAFNAPVTGFHSEYYLKVWYGKNRMMGLPKEENSLRICLLVSTQYTNVTDTQTYKQTDERTDRYRTTASRG